MLKQMLFAILMSVVVSGSAWAGEERSNQVLTGEQKECNLMSAKHVGEKKSQDAVKPLTNGQKQVAKR